MRSSRHRPAALLRFDITRAFRWSLLVGLLGGCGTQPTEGGGQPVDATTTIQVKRDARPGSHDAGSSDVATAEPDAAARTDVAARVDAAVTDDAAAGGSADGAPVVNAPIVSYPAPRPGTGGPAAVDDLPQGDPCQDRSITGPDAVVQNFSFDFWMPGGVRALRCVFGAGATRDMARLHHCAVMRMPASNITGVRDYPRGPVLVAALKHFATLTGHPEIEHLQILSTGYSYTAGQRQQQLHDVPERFMAVFTGGVGTDRPRTPAAARVPWMGAEGEKDNGAGTKWVSSLAEIRAQGALYTKAIRWGAGHEEGDNDHLMFPFFHQVLARRGPPAGVPLTAMRVVDIKETDGWLLGIPGWDTPYPTIAPFNAFPGDRAKTSWAFDSFTAHVWRAYQAKGSPIRLLEPVCNGQCVPRSAGIKSLVLVDVDVSGEPPVSVDLWDGDRKLFPLPAPDYRVQVTDIPPGVHAFIAEATYADGRKALSKPRSVVVNKPGSNCDRPPTEAGAPPP